MACALVYLHQARLGSSLQGFVFNVRYGFVPERFFTHPLTAAPTLVTNLFLHGSLLHLLGNLLFLVVFADTLEDRLGSGRFALFYLLGGALSNLAYALLSDAARVPLIGASGAISTVLGAYLVLFPRLRVRAFVPPFLLPWLVLSLFARVPRFFLLWCPAWLFIGYWFLVQLAEATTHVALLQPGASAVAWWAHVGGFAFGVVAVSAFLRRSKAPRWR
ncbi:MAG: rhomboid family intramembrane serine protease [Deinococcales bacterium]